MQSIIRYILGYAGIVFLAGLAILGFAFYSLWQVTVGQAYTPYEQLTPLSAYVNSVQHVTKKGKRGSIRNQYYELTVSDRSADRQYRLRMDASVPENLAGSLVKQNIDVLVDENNESLIYQLAVVDEANNAHLVLPYEDTQKHLQSKAEDNAKNPFIWLAGLVLTLLGIFALWLKRKRRQIQAMT